MGGKGGARQGPPPGAKQAPTQSQAQRQAEQKKASAKQQARAAPAVDLAQLAREMSESLIPVLEPYGYTKDDVWELVQRFKCDPANVQAAVANILEDHKGHEQGEWQGLPTVSDKKAKAEAAKERREQKEKEIQAALEQDRLARAAAFDRSVEEAKKRRAAEANAKLKGRLAVVEGMGADTRGATGATKGAAWQSPAPAGSAEPATEASAPEQSTSSVEMSNQEQAAPEAQPESTNQAASESYEEWVAPEAAPETNGWSAPSWSAPPTSAPAPQQTLNPPSWTAQAMPPAPTKAPEAPMPQMPPAKATNVVVVADNDIDDMIVKMPESFHLLFGKGVKPVIMFGSLQPGDLEEEVKAATVRGLPPPGSVTGGAGQDEEWADTGAWAASGNGQARAPRGDGKGKGKKGNNKGKRKGDGKGSDWSGDSKGYRADGDGYDKKGAGKGDKRKGGSWNKDGRREKGSKS